MPQFTLNRNEEILLAALLAAIGLQGLQVLALSAFGMLPLCWIGGLLLLFGLATLKYRLWKASAPGEWKELSSGWFAPWPWIIGILLAIQIALYPPTMSDSLCYRLPRMFFALQEGGITRFPTPDARMTGMPWGWEMLALPFASLNALNASKFINLSCWAIVYQILFSLLRSRDMPHARARCVALALATAPVFLLQATSTANDLYAATLLLIGVWMIHRFAQAPGPVPVLASLLSLVLAANAKPQFLVLGLPWLLWWVLAPLKPWKQVSWWVLALSAPLFFLVSPLPTLIGNLHLTGNLLGVKMASTTSSHPSFLLMIAAGSIQFLFTQIQLPFLPVTISLPEIKILSSVIPGFKPESKQLFLIDWASLGLIHFLLLTGGMLLCLRIRSIHSWPWIAAFLLGFIISSSQVVPTTIGRSFVGFLSLLLPLAAWGLASLKNQKLFISICTLAIASGMAAMALNPSAPLWPSHTLASIAKERGMKSLTARFETYHAYQKRALTGFDILDPVPHGETVSLLLRQITPVSPLWHPDWQARRIEYVNHIDPDSFAAGQSRWLVVGNNAAEFQPDETIRYSSLPGWSAVHSRTYLPNLSQGPETWTLYRKSAP